MQDNNKSLLEKLHTLGFKEYEAKVFMVLLKGGAMSASEIADKAKIRRTAVYDILKSFAQKGYCNEIETNSILSYEMIEPRIISDKIERDILNDNNNLVKHLQESFKEFEPLYRSQIENEKDNVNIELIRGFNRHREQKFHEIFKLAKQEVLFMIRLEGYISEEIDETAKKFIKNGGVIRSIYEISPSFKIKLNNHWVQGKKEDLIKICKSYKNYGEELKLSEKQLLNMTVFDREIVFTSVNDKSIPRHNKSDVIIKNKDYAKNMIDLFEYYWASSYTIEEYSNQKSEVINQK